MIQLVTDSTSDLPKELIERYNISVVPLTINIDGENYYEEIDISSEEFYHKMQNAKNFPKTSMPSPGEFAKVFNDLLKKGPVLPLYCV